MPGCGARSEWIVEKNVQDRRRQLWVEAGTRHWPSLEALNDWLATECRAAWEMMTHPDCPVQTLADAWQDEVPQLMPLPAAFDDYPAVAPLEPHSGRPQGAEATVGGEQTSEHGLPAEGTVRTAVELPHASRSTEVLRALTRCVEVAAAQTL
jgi:hypothetical protein